MSAAPLLVADLGGTSLRIGVSLQGRLLHLARLPSAGLGPDAAPAIRRYLDSLSALPQPLRPQAACVAVAGPVSGGRVRLTNVGLSLDAADLPLPAALINDLHGAALGVDRVPAQAILHLGGGPARPGEALAVLGVGTGLGEAVRIGATVLPGEGGHGAYAPVDDEGRALHAWLLARHGSTEWEDVACGTAFGQVLEFARAAQGTSEALAARLSSGEPPAATVLALPQDPACALTLRLVLTALGTEAGNAGLRQLCTGGVWLIGGTAGHLRPWLQDPQGPFHRAFETRRGRYAALARGLPRLLVLDDDVGLYGAAVVAAGLLS